MRRRSGYVLLEWIIGILFIVFGIYSYIRPDNMLTGIVILYGVIAIVSGIADILFYIRTDRYTGFGPTICLISGIFSIMAGFMLAVYPNAGKWILVLLLPVWFIAHCVSRLTHLNYIRIMAGKFYYYLTLAVNVVGIVLGCLMILRPAVALFSTGFLIGTYFILLGVDCILTAISRTGSKW